MFSKSFMIMMAVVKIFGIGDIFLSKPVVCMLGQFKILFVLMPTVSMVVFITMLSLNMINSRHGLQNNS